MGLLVRRDGAVTKYVDSDAGLVICSQCGARVQGKALVCSECREVLGNEMQVPGLVAVREELTYEGRQLPAASPEGRLAKFQRITLVVLIVVAVTGVAVRLDWLPFVIYAYLCSVIAVYGTILTWVFLFGASLFGVTCFLNGRVTKSDD